MKRGKTRASAYGTDGLREIFRVPQGLSPSRLTHDGMKIVSPSCDPEGITGHYRSDLSHGSRDKEQGDLLGVDELFR